MVNPIIRNAPIRKSYLNKKWNKNADIFCIAFTFNKMVDLDLQIKNIQDKLQQLLRQQALLQKENQKLKKDLEKAMLDNGEKEQSLQAIRQQVDVIKMGSGNLNDAEKKRFEQTDRWLSQRN